MKVSIRTIDDEGKIRWLRQLPPEPASARPLIVFRTLNGYQLWPAPLPDGAEKTAALRVRRAFAIQTPAGETLCCLLELTPGLCERVRVESGHDYPPADPIWDAVCRMALSEYLWQRGQRPPAALAIDELSRQQLEVVRRIARLGSCVRR